jgi:uncharacterized protein (UPF0333 family)
MKRIRFALLILIIAIAAVFFFWKNLNHTGKVGLKDFAIENPSKIDKIFFASNNKAKGWLQLEKDKAGIWWVKNGQKRLKADTHSIKDLLYYVMANLQVKNPVNDASLNSLNREMALNAVKAEFYTQDKLLKTIYVGGPTADLYGTYMYLPNQGNALSHDRPCIVTVPSHNGYVTPYFNSEINNWRTTALIDVPASAIQSVKVQWPAAPQDNFSINVVDDNPQLFDGAGAVQNVNRNRLLAYLDMFTGVSREAGDLAGINKDFAAKSNLLKSEPFCIIEVVNKQKEATKLKLYYRPIGEETYTPETKTGELKTHEIDSYWAVLEGTDEIWVVQEAIVKNRMRRLRDFNLK